MTEPTKRQMYAKAMGDLALEYLTAQGAELAASAAESRATTLISGIRAILDDDTLDDPECFKRIEAIVELYHEAGLKTTRHDFG